MGTAGNPSQAESPLASIDPETEKLLVRIKSRCDDFGGFSADPAIVAEMASGDDVPDLRAIASRLEWLRANNIIRIKDIDGHRMLTVVGFKRCGEVMVARHPPISGDEPETSAVSDDARAAARKAFDRWSMVSRGYGLNDLQNEGRRLDQFLENVSQSAPIVRGSEQIQRYLLVPQAVEGIMAEQTTDFKNISYATKCVSNRLDEWGRTGIKTADSNGNGAPHGPRKNKTFDV